MQLEWNWNGIGMGLNWNENRIDTAGICLSTRETIT